MVKFEERMRESTGLFKDEQRIFDISQRLAEQTEYVKAQRHIGVKLTRILAKS